MTPLALAGADSGGTFTDGVAEDGSFVKVLSTPDDPSVAVARGLVSLGSPHPEVLAHGTTVATNALLERRGGRVALVTNEGFGDLVEIARQNRPSLYDQWADRPEPLAPRELRYEVDGRIGPAGEEVGPLGPVPSISGADCVAVCLLHSDLNDCHERAVEEVLAGRGHDVCRSSEVSPEMREYERTATTVLNAYLRPVCARYMSDLGALADEVLVMTSAGGLVPLGEAAGAPVRLLVSGPAAGVRAGSAAAAASGFPDVVTFDMGGTSTDVCLVRDGSPAPAGQRQVEGFPVRVPSLDVHTIGAGGGSVAWIDKGGALRVGPRSAGAAPGPASYGLGGRDVTVTDADLLAGRIAAGARLGGIGPLDNGAAQAAFKRLGVTPEAVVAVADAAMVQAIRAVTVERGVDPRDVALVAFGGAGPLHACALADALGMPAVIVPARAGVLSAVGLLSSPRQVDLVRSFRAAPTEAREACSRLEAEARAVLDSARPSRGAGSAAVVSASALDCRYVGQSHEITVPRLEDFEAEHESRNGYFRPGSEVEVVAVRAQASVPSRISPADLPATPERTGRTGVEGPAVVSEPDCTVWVPNGWNARVGGGGSWVMERR